MKIYNRETKEYQEIEQFGQGALQFLYGNVVGRLLLKLAVSPVVSDIYAWCNGGEWSTKKIPEFVVKNGIRMDDFEDRDYRSFNDFFTRKLRPGARHIVMDSDVLISPADAKLLVYPINRKIGVFVKGRMYSLEELTGRRQILSEYAGGICLVYRLCMEDYHRYCFIDDGSIRKRYRIKGKLHTVSSLSEKYKIYKENSRVINSMVTKHFGEMIQIEVGAMLVGRIKNKRVRCFSKGKEKGYFEPGGSTIIQIFKPDMITMDQDILEQSRKQIETRVLYGERVGVSKCFIECGFT